jgi:hypothetical protein
MRMARISVSSLPILTRQHAVTAEVHHASTVLTVHLAEHTVTIDLDDGDRRTFHRPTTQAVRNR